MRHHGKKLLVALLVTYLLIELTCYIFIKSGHIKANLPDFNYSFTLTAYPFTIGDIDSVWGAWHYREPFRRKENCLNFDYHINSWGARDIERTKQATDTDRVLVLGDSFMEGYGMAEKDRVSSRLEQGTNRQFLNFACTDFGTTQEYLLYQHLGLQFVHSTLLIGIFPFNDFEDNDTSLHLNPYYKRFRPYFKGIAPDYHLVYKEDSIQKSNFNKRGFLKKENSTRALFVRFFRAYTCWFNILTYYLDARFVGSQKQSSGYYHYTAEQWNKMSFILKKIKELAGSRRMVIITIPTAEDIKTYNKLGDPPLHAAMDSLCKANKMEFVDLLKPFAARPHSEQTFYFDCDPHWNEAGNQFAAEILKPLFK
jgi:hypothetical protein